MRYIPLIVQFDFEHTNIVVDLFLYSPLNCLCPLLPVVLRIILYCLRSVGHISCRDIGPFFNIMGCMILSFAQSSKKISTFKKTQQECFLP